MLVDLLFVAAVVGLLIAIYKIKFSKENINREIEEETTRLAREREEQKRREYAREDEPKEEERGVEANANSESAWQGGDSSGS